MAHLGGHETGDQVERPFKRAGHGWRPPRRRAGLARQRQVHRGDHLAPDGLLHRLQRRRPLRPVAQVLWFRRRRRHRQGGPACGGHRRRGRVQDNHPALGGLRRRHHDVRGAVRQYRGGGCTQQSGGGHRGPRRGPFLPWDRQLRLLRQAARTPSQQTSGKGRHRHRDAGQEPTTPRRSRSGAPPSES